MTMKPVHPLCSGTAEQFAACRQVLESVGYTEERLRERYRLSALSSITARSGRAATIDDALELLTQLFVDGAWAARSQIETLLPPGSLDVLARLGLVRPAEHNAELWIATVMLYPRSGLFLVSDRAKSSDGGPVGTVDDARDIVFSALTDNTERFLENLPDGPCQRFLDLGTGTGVAALVAARSAAEVWAVDITERAVAFAEFNRQLNAVSNVTVVQGDLYEPVKDLHFDRIVIHPPYVPALRQGLVFQDAGVDGQEITRGAVAGLWRHLIPGGRFYCLSLGADREDLAFEHWVRQWLGRHEGEFDLAFIPRNTISPEFLARSVAVKGGGLREASLLHQGFDRLGIREFPYGTIIIQRHASPRSPFTIRRQRGSHSGRDEIEWLFGWETRRATETDGAWLLGLRPVASPDVELRVIHRMVDGELTPAAYALQTEYPFSMESSIPPWIAVLVARCDGTATGHDHYAYLREQGAFPEHVTEPEFARLLGTLVSGGFIQVPAFVLPRHASR
jgi:methylase of polypeptide subunit release factors